MVLVRITKLRTRETRYEDTKIRRIVSLFVRFPPQSRLSGPKTSCSALIIRNCYVRYDKSPSRVSSRNNRECTVPGKSETNTILERTARDQDAIREYFREFLLSSTIPSNDISREPIVKILLFWNKERKTCKTRIDKYSSKVN